MTNKRSDIEAPRFVIERDAAGRFRYAFLASTRAVLLSSMAFGTLDEARASIERLRGQLRSEGWARRHAANDGTGYWFEICGPEGNALGSSIPFQSRYARELAMERLEFDVHAAPIELRDA